MEIKFGNSLVYDSGATYTVLDIKLRGKNSGDGLDAWIETFFEVKNGRFEIDYSSLADIAREFKRKKLRIVVDEGFSPPAELENSYADAELEIGELELISVGTQYQIQMATETFEVEECFLTLDGDGKWQGVVNVIVDDGHGIKSRRRVPFEELVQRVRLESATIRPSTSMNEDRFWGILERSEEDATDVWEQTCCTK